MDHVEVNYYGCPTPINQIASISVQEGKTLVIKPYDASSLKDIEKAINASDIGLPPLNDGTVVRITMPVLTEETRKGFCKDIAKYGEETKVAIRNIRRDANDEIKKDKTLPEDTAKDLQDQVQKLTDKFVEKTDMPVCCTAMALGVVPADLPNYTGMIGMHGTVTSNKLANECDLFIALDARFSDRVATNFKTFAPNAKVLHIDIDPAEINKNIAVTGSVIGDVNEVVVRLNNMLDKEERPEWMAYMEECKKENPLKYDHDGSLKPQYIMEKINEVTKGDAIVVTDVGQHQMFSAQFFEISD